MIPRSDWTPPGWSVLLVLLVVVSLTPRACDHAMAPAPLPQAVQR